MVRLFFYPYYIFEYPDRSSIAGELSQSVGKSFIKSYSAVCLERAIIVFAGIIFSLFAAAPLMVNPAARQLRWCGVM